MTGATAARPVRGLERIHSLDVIRGVALFGILLMNITLFGMPMVYSDPTVYGGATGANLWAWIIATVGFEGTQRALFSVLFGAGLVLLKSRLESAGRADAADKLSPRALMTLALAGLLFGAAWNVLDSYTATQESEKAQAAHASLASGSYVDVLVFQAPIAMYFEHWYFYRYFFDVFSLMLLGMASFKLGVLTLQQPSRVYWMMVLIGYPLGLAVNLYELDIVIDGEFSVLAFLRASWTYDLGRLAMTAGHLGTLLLFCRSGALGWLQRGLAAVGRMALTSYISHSVTCAFVFYGFGLGLYGQLERHELYYVVGSIWLFQLIASPIWLKYYRFGPLEWLWRTLTYLERQPMRRRTDVGTPMPKPQPS
jgi:uncharacterized protein